MTHNTSPSTRMERINMAVAHELSQFLLMEVEDKRLKTAQINRAIVSKDLSFAKIYFTVLDIDNDIDPKKLAKLLTNAAGLFRRHLAATLNLRVTPELKFYYDEDAIKTQHLLSLLDKI